MARNIFALVFLSAALMLATASAKAVVGGKSAADVNTPEVSAAAQQAVNMLNHKDSTQLQGLHLNGLLSLAKIKSVSSQVVAGISYTIILTVKDATGAESDLEVAVWSRPWLAAKNDAANPAYTLTSVKRVTDTA